MQDANPNLRTLTILVRLTGYDLLAQLLSIRGLVGSEDSYWTAYHYLRQRTGKMDYVSYRRLRLPIGSRPTFGRCPHGSSLQSGIHATLQAVGHEVDA